MKKEEELFSAALALPPAERAAFLERACGADSGLRQRVAALLEAAAASGDFLEKPAVFGALGGVPPPVCSPAEEYPGLRIGRYKLLEKLGEGGCGVVWMAEQEEPIRRTVALKVIKLGMDTKQVIARFESERQALALMDHPNVARVLDAGATDTGRPFFVMELVRGLKLTVYCDRNRLSTAERLGLFIQICHAVQHAHQKGIIHRDLKPSNILVTEHDGAPVPKVIDFGIAKATQGRLTDLTLFTAFEQFLGTPAYMSPEQASFTDHDVDTRSDIYSLGVLLYELITGQPPFDPRTLRQAGLDEVRRIIREVEPPKPSTRLTSLEPDTLTNTAQSRHTEPPRLIHGVRGDLDWIVMRCLEKQRSRRYETADALALDLGRHLHDEPVAARPPGRLYRLAKLARRNRFAVTTAAAVALALVAGTITSTWQALRAREAERTAERERSRAEDLLGFMLGDLRRQLAKLGRLDVLESVGDKAMAYFASRQPGELSDTELLRHAKTLTQIGEVRLDQARFGAAADAFNEAFARSSALAALQPHNADALFERSQTEYWVGQVNQRRGDFSAAQLWLNRYFTTCQVLVSLEPARAKWQLELAYGHEALAALRQQQGDSAAARSGFLSALAILDGLLAAAPHDLDLRFSVANVHSWLGELAEQQGEFAEALNRYREQTARLDLLVDAEPRAVRWRSLRADSLLFQTSILIATGDFPAATALLSGVRRQLDELASGDAANQRWKALALLATLKEAELAWHRGDRRSAAKSVEVARAGFEALVKTEPNSPAFRLRLASALRMQARIRSALAEPDWDAPAIASVEILEKLLKDGASDKVAAECASSHIVAGVLRSKAGQHESARDHWRRADEVLAPRLPGSRFWRLLDPGARVAALSGRAQDARALVARLDSLGYVPLDPWPDAAANPDKSPNP